MIVEVLSPSTSALDPGPKLLDYVRIPSLRHYLIIWPDAPRVGHHRRTPDGAIATEAFTAGEIALDPPGFTISLAALYAD